MELVDPSLKGQEEIWQLMFGFADSMALKCAVELQIPDIISSHGGPITLPEIAAAISRSSPPSSAVDVPYLSRVMRSLVRKKIFTAHHGHDHDDDDRETVLYGLSESSKWLLREGSGAPSLVPMVLMETHPWQMGPWHQLGECVRAGGIAFEKAHGCEMWDFAAARPEFNKLFNDAMACAVRIVMGAVLAGYREGFGCVAGTLVDVGGGTGGAVAEIVRAHPHIRGINFDLPHVIDTAPAYDGLALTHVGGDMFEAIPTADAVFIKWVLHDWSDEHCLKILRNCRKAIEGKKNGKVIIVDIVLEPNKNDMFDDTRMVFDLLMLAHTTGGKERTELDWNKLLKEAGFARYKITKIPIIPSIIEAFPV